MSQGAVAILIVLALLALLAFATARRRSSRSVFARYAKARGMTLISTDRGRLPEKTPLLRKGDQRYAERLLEGPLHGGPEGLLANYTYVEGSGAAEQRRCFTIAYLTVPESVPLAPELFVRRRSGPDALEPIEDALAGPRSRVELESADLDRAYEIIASELQDQNRMRQLFSPSFIVWLIDEAPEGLCFELSGGRLCCYVEGHARTEFDLDRIAAAAVIVAERLQEEASEN